MPRPPSDSRPFLGRRARTREALPFALATALPFASLALPGPPLDVAPLLVGAVLSAAFAAAVTLVPWRRVPDLWALGPALGYLAAVALLREGSGGNSSGFGPMVLLPVVWLALYGTRRTLAVTIAGAGLVYWLPIVLDEAAYPESGWRIGTLLVGLSAVVGLAVQRLHDDARSQVTRVERLAYLDELTGLPNRRGWDAALEAERRVSHRRGETLCLALIDVDEFKRVNDTGGHAAGDALLMTVAQAWTGLLRRGDVLARTGGDEFALLLPACGLTEAKEVAERLRAASRQATCSIGLVRWDGAEDEGQVMARADSLLYEAKRLGRDRLVAQT
jgi:diguanylate cyclase (GGDEF)-like protein